MKQTIGTVKTMFRYPVKSMGGESITAAQLTYAGLAGDRIYAFINLQKAGNFPWHSAREQNDLLLYKPKFKTPPQPDVFYPSKEIYQVDVTTPSGKVFAIDDVDLLAELQAKAAYPIQLRFSERSMVDARPISIFGLKTAAGLSQEAGLAIDPRRFRANLYVEWKEATPFYEDQLVGAQLEIGERAEVMIVKKDPRCVMINLDPDTAAAQPEVLKTVAKLHRGCAGVYAAVLREGVVKEGDVVSLKA